MRKQFLVRTVLAFLALQILGSASFLRAQANVDVFGDVFNVKNFGATGKKADIAYMVDQSHNLKNKVEEMIQTACTAQEMYLKAALVDREKLVAEQAKGNLIDAEECLREAFFTDVRPLLREWRKSKGLAEEPLAAHRASGYNEKAEAERSERNRGAVASYA